MRRFFRQRTLKYLSAQRLVICATYSFYSEFLNSLQCLRVVGLNLFLPHSPPLDNTSPAQRLKKAANKMTEEEWRKVLPEDVFHVARQAGTEPPHSSKYVKNCATGRYKCFCCGADLFV